MNQKRTFATLICFAMLAGASEVVSDKCFEELVELPNTKANFNMSSFSTELATTVVKVQGGAKFSGIPLLGSSLGPGPDNKMTEAGITVGCAKQIPTDAGKMKSLLTNVGIGIGKSAIAGKLGLKKEEMPNNLSELKDFAVKTASLKAGKALGIEEGEMPTDLKGAENLISAKIKSQAAEKLGVEESSIPNNKSELSGFIKNAAKAKIASELGVKPTEVNLDRASLVGYASENETLAPIAGLANAASALEVLGLINGLSALTGEGGGGNEKELERLNVNDVKAVSPAETKEDSESSVNFGLRLGYNGSTVLYEGQNYGLGHGVEAGLVVNIPISSSFEISVGANGIYRKPYTKETIDQNSQYIKSELIEYAGSIPIMLKYNISSFFLQIGLQVDAPLKKEQKTTKGAEVIWEENTWRADYDLGGVFGLGFNINKNISLDMKVVGGATEYNKEIGGYKLIQGSIGISYFFLGGEQKKEAAPTPTAAAPTPTAVAPTPTAVAPTPTPAVEEEVAPPAPAAKDPAEGAKVELEDAANKWIKDLKAPANTNNFTFEVSEPMDGEGSYGLKATSKVKIGDCPAKSVWEIGYEGCDRYNNVPKDCKALTPKVITDYEGDNGC
ncbi:hypothetical protein R83H12_01799 [Fibrobacteria bacterium R8-3-H12]